MGRRESINVRTMHKLSFIENSVGTRAAIAQFQWGKIIRIWREFQISTIFVSLLFFEDFDVQQDKFQGKQHLQNHRSDSSTLKSSLTAHPSVHDAPDIIRCYCTQEFTHSTNPRDRFEEL
jgi:hypothetical protein